MEPPKTLKKKYLVEKRNLLNEIQSGEMSLPEIRFFCIYLSKINARDPNTRIVRFSINDFQTIMGLGRAHYEILQKAAHNLLKKLVVIPKENEECIGETAMALFITCEVERNKEDGYGYVEITAHPEAMPLLFDYKNKYFVYEIWNALRLKSVNQIRMYEILKQCEHIGHRTVKLKELKELLGIREEEHTRYNNFKARVLEPCREALTQYTDIKFSYEPCGRPQRGNRVIALKFTIEKNTDYEEPMSCQEFIEMHGGDEREAAAPEEEERDNPYQTGLDLLYDACDGEFTRAQIEALYPLVLHYYGQKRISFPQANYLRQLYLDVKAKNGVRSRFGYVRAEIKKHLAEKYNKAYLELSGVHIKPGSYDDPE